jgi:hypothetical protein
VVVLSQKNLLGRSRNLKHISIIALSAAKALRHTEIPDAVNVNGLSVIRVALVDVITMALIKVVKKRGIKNQTFPAHGVNARQTPSQHLGTP